VSLRRGRKHPYDLHKLRTEANHPTAACTATTRPCTSLLRYGVPVKTEAGKATETVHLIDWKEATNNDFAIAEEVTLKGKQQRRPDLVLYVNGIAIGVLELKNSRVSIGDGIRQLPVEPAARVQRLVLQHRAVRLRGQRFRRPAIRHHRHPEKFFLTWKEDEADNSRFKLDKYLLKMCNKARSSS
jgi:type I restriction enzyme R subunit